MLLQTFAIMGRRINHFELRDADVVLQPALAGVSGADFRRAPARDRGRPRRGTGAAAELRAAIAAKTR